jgi:TPR repeat protein
MAAGKKSSEELVKVGKHFEYEIGTEKSDAHAYHYYQLAAHLGSSEGLFHVGRFCEFGYFCLLKPSLEKAIENYVKNGKFWLSKRFLYGR